MSAVMLAVFSDCETADRVRVALVRDGFPTDRVSLTARDDLGRAGLAPADSPHGKCVQYFRTLLGNKGEQQHPEALARRVGDGAAVIAVHPRGAIETARATELLQQANPAEMVGRNLTRHRWEWAAARSEGSWIKHIWLESLSDTHCIYCRLFPAARHTQLVPSMTSRGATLAEAESPGLVDGEGPALNPL